MISAKDFFLELQEEEEYLSCLMTKDTYSGIDHELRELIVVSSVKQQNKEFANNEELQTLYKDRSKIKKKITKIEFNINNR